MIITEYPNKDDVPCSQGLCSICRNTSFNLGIILSMQPENLLTYFLSEDFKEPSRKCFTCSANKMPSEPQSDTKAVTGWSIFAIGVDLVRSRVLSRPLNSH